MDETTLVSIDATTLLAFVALLFVARRVTKQRVRRFKA